MMQVSFSVEHMYGRRVDTSLGDARTQWCRSPGRDDVGRERRAGPGDAYGRIDRKGISSLGRQRRPNIELAASGIPDVELQGLRFGRDGIRQVEA